MRLQFASAALLAATSLLPVATAPVRAEPASLVWTACTDVPDTQCASLDVPIDRARPEGPRLSVRLGRVPAMDPSSSKGTLLFIPGGPGAGVAEMFGAYRGIFNVDELRREHDVVTFDPRGVGQSSPVRCEAEPVPSAPITGITSVEEFGALERASARFAAGCFERTGELMAHLSAMDTAADIEHIRVALGQSDGLVAYSASYGTNYAAAYLERYEQNVKALVLDAVFDHSIDLPTLAAHNADGVEDAFGRFADWCEQDPTCALNGQDVRGVFEIGGTWVPDREEKTAAWELYVELVTRISVVELQPSEGLLREALSSLYSLFQTTRSILTAHGPGIAVPKGNGQLSFGYLAVAMLNLGIRPVVAKWQPLLLHWESSRATDISPLEHEQRWPESAELRRVLNELRTVLIQYADTLARVAGVPSLTVAHHADEALPSGPY
jgi:pimeloyl-ACP methyl ester carboxylesterase